MNTAKILTITAGIIGAGLVGYDAHKTGVMTSQQNIKERIAGRLPDHYISSRRQDSTSTVTSNLRDGIFRHKSNWSLPDKINAVTGYAKGAFNQLAEDIVPAVLATGALVKNRFSKHFAIGLGVCGTYYLLSNLLDWGRIKHFRD